MPRKTITELQASQWDTEFMLTDEKEIEKLVLYETDPEKHVARIIFNNPEQDNCLPLAAIERIAILTQEAEYDNDVKVIIYKGNGPCFGAGANAAELGHYIGYKAGRTKEERIRPTQRQRMLADKNLGFGGTTRGVAQTLKVTISQVHRFCYGEHIEIALASDIVIASDDALFGHPAFRYLGPSPQDMYLWIENMGLKKMKELMFSMRAMSAEEAHQCGFVTKVVPREDLEKWVEDYAQAIALMPLDAIMIGKAMIGSITQARGAGLGTMTGWIGHGWSTNLSLAPDEWNFVKERRDKGLPWTLKERDQMVAPYFRLGSTRSSE